MARPDTEWSDFHLGFRPSLEGLRGVAVLLVVAFHCLTFFDFPLYERTARGGFIGVDVFFTLSGFLITSLLLAEHRDRGGIAIGAFYLRRASRLLPAVVALLVGTGVYVAVTGLSVTKHLGVAGAVLTYTSNFFIARKELFPRWLNHMWSLAIEEQFYLVWPLTLMLLLRFTKARPPFVAAAIGTGIAAGWSIRAALFHHYLLSARVYFRPDARADQLLWGALLAVACVAGWIRPRSRAFLAGVGVAGIVAMSWFVSPLSAPYFYVFATAAAVSTVAVIAATLEGGGPVGAWLRMPPLRWVGRISYALYLWHVPVIGAVQRYLNRWSFTSKSATSVVISVALAQGSHVLVEQPFLRLRKRWVRVKDDPAVP